MFNPWLLASALFAAIGLLDEANKSDSKKAKTLPAPKKVDKPAPPVIVNVDAKGVQSESKKNKPKPKPKPSGEVPNEPLGDG